MEETVQNCEINLFSTTFAFSLRNSRFDEVNVVVTLLCNLFLIDLSETGNFVKDWSLFFEMPHNLSLVGYDKGWLISGWLTFESVNAQQVLDIDEDVWMSCAVGQHFVSHSRWAVSVLVVVAHHLTVWWDVSEDCLAATGSTQSVNSSSLYMVFLFWHVCLER